MKTTRHLKRTIRISRPSSWLQVLIIYFGTFLYFNIHVSAVAFLQGLSFTFPLLFFAFYYNNKFDKKTDVFNKYKKSGSNSYMRGDEKYSFLIKWCLLIMIIFSLFSFNIQNIILTLFMIFVYYYYSAPPLRFKEIPVLANFITFLWWLLIVLIAYTYGHDFFSLPKNVIYAIFLVIPGHLMTSIADYSPDRKSNIRTIVTIMGIRFSAFLMFVSLVFILYFSNFTNVFILFFAYYLIVVSVVLFLTSSEKFANLVWKYFHLFFIINSLLFLFFEII